MNHTYTELSGVLRRIAAVGLTAAMTLTLLAGCGSKTAPEQKTSGETAANSATSAQSGEEAVEETVPATIPADGNPDDATCKGTYTAEESQLEAAASMFVAFSGSGRLTNSQLQAYYWMEVASYREADHEIAPDFDKPLDSQVCDIDDSVTTWQQYFLQQALNTWHTQQALITMGEKEGTPTEEAYDPNEENHEKYMTGMPATKYLYGYTNASYSPNEIHQEYLDNLPTLLEELAKENGFAGLAEQVEDLAGSTATVEDMVNYAETMNRAYMYFTERGYYFEPTAEEVEAYFTEHEEEYRAEGITRESGKYVNIRQLLMIPEGATVAEDGTVTCDEEAWEKGLKKAQNMLNEYLWGHKTEAKFSELANKNSADPGSSINGGLYRELSQGQLVEELDEWCFDEARQTGDTTIIRTACGYHILYFSGSTDIWYDEAEEDLLYQLSYDMTVTARENYPLTVLYEAICLGQAEQSGEALCDDDILYADIAHQRYPTPPLYLQQDYPTTYYGNYKITTHGCGITTMAMLASYMTDTELTPPELCARYGKYSFENGTNIIMYDDTPAEMGFYMERRTYIWADMEEALNNGQIVIALQTKGYWTRGGHFILLQEMNEDGTVVVRDSNIFNYGKLENHKTDGHTPSSITANGKFFWIFDKKVTRIPTCQRCGETTQGIPYAMFTEDYECEKCDAALLRRGNFVAVCDALN